MIRSIKIFLVLLTCSNSFAYCQKRDTLRNEFPNYRNNVFAEAGGALWYTIGYEHVLYSFKKLPFELYANASFSYMPNGGQFFTNPTLGLTYGRKHQVDLEIRGLVAWNLGVPISSWQDELRAKREGRNFILPAETASSVGIGYRFVFLNGRLMIRAKPLYQFKYDFAVDRFDLSRFWFNVGVAYKFGKR